MNPEHARFADSDAAYVLGALSVAERAEYERHLESCAQCRTAVAELASMPGLLARVPRERVESIDALSDVAPPVDLIELVSARRARGRRRVRIAILGGIAAALVVIGAIVTPAVLTSGPAVQRLALEPVGTTSLSATVALTPKAWGTQLDMECEYADAAGDRWDYALWVTDRSGAASEVSSWSAVPGATARLTASTAIDLADISSIEVRPLHGEGVVLRGDPN